MFHHLTYTRAPFFNIFFLFIFLLLCKAAHANESLVLYLDEFEGGKVKPHHQQVLSDYMANQNCTIKFTSRPDQANLVLAINSTHPPQFKPWLNIQTHNNLPLNLSVVVKSSRAVDNLTQLEGERIAIINPLAQIGFLNDIGDLNAQGLDLDNGPIFESGRYDGALALLLHGDVFAAVLPTPLAEKWRIKNKLSIIAKSHSQPHPALWLKETTSQLGIKNCETAFQKIAKEPNNEALLKVFPLWVEGFGQ